MDLEDQGTGVRKDGRGISEFYWKYAQQVPRRNVFVSVPRGCSGTHPVGKDDTVRLGMTGTGQGE